MKAVTRPFVYKVAKEYTAIPVISVLSILYS